LLDRTQPDPGLNAEDAAASPALDSAATETPHAQGWRPLGWLRRAGQFFFALSFSSLTRRIVSLNLAGLVALVASILYLSQFRAGLIDARAENLLSTGEVIARAIAATGTTEANGPTIDPDRLLDLKPGESFGPTDDALSSLDFPINPERIAPVLRGLISPTKTRARIYDRDGVLILDSRSFPGRGDVMRFELKRPESASVQSSRFAPGSTVATCRSIVNSGRRTARATTKSRAPSTASKDRWCGSTTAAKSSSR
jgi:two-component system, OmpR family, sensor histidine kinase ChvG